MKNIIHCILAIGFLISCNLNSEGNMIVKGNIDGLKKGTIYLQKYTDTLLVSVDSAQINGISEFILSTDIETPEMYFITLDNNIEDKIPFFGEKGEIAISSKLSKFLFSAKISGSVNQDLLNDHTDMIKKFTNKKLDLLKEKIEAQISKDTALVKKIEIEENSLLKRKYFFTTNFAVNNAEHEVAAYLAISELYYGNIKLLDTINNSLSKKVQKSKYGVELENFIQGIKNNE